MRRQVSRSLAGRKAQASGKAFEEAFETICAQNGFTCIRIPNACRSIPRYPWIIRSKSPFDFVIARKGFTVFLDLKSTTHNSFSYGMLNDKQIKTLNAARHDAVGGYLIHFVTVNKIIWFDVKRLSALQPRQSLKPEDGLELGVFGYQCNLGLLESFKEEFNKT